MPDSLDRIERTIIALRSGFLSADLAQWLDKGLVACTKGESLDKALGEIDNPTFYKVYGYCHGVLETKDIHNALPQENRTRNIYSY